MTDAKLADLEERFAEIKGVRMRYFVGGEGPPLILVHGLGGAAANWTELVPLLVRRHRLLVPDLPGHGSSTALPAVARTTAQALAAFLMRGVHCGAVATDEVTQLTGASLETVAKLADRRVG